jgi:hypothetical protein
MHELCYRWDAQEVYEKTFLTTISIIENNSRIIVERRKLLNFFSPGCDMK